jgi:hypothetical protein
MNRSFRDGNDSRCNRNRVRRAAVTVVGAENVLEFDTRRWLEKTFRSVLQKIPALLFVFVGGRNTADDAVYPQHH